MELRKKIFYDSVGQVVNTTSNSIQQRLTKYTVHIRTCATRDEAEGLLDKLNNNGFFGYYTPVRQADKVVYHVRVGVFAEESEASKTLAKLQTKTKIAGSVSQLH